MDPTEFLARVLLPFLLTRFVLLPAPLLFIPDIGAELFSNAIVNLIIAELLTNVHGFITIVTNHAGNDLYKFDDEVRPKTGSFYVRQIVSSTNYEYGEDWLDFSHGWLNYQVSFKSDYSFSAIFYVILPLFTLISKIEHHGKVFMIICNTSK